MFTWLAQNLATILVAALVLALFVGICIKLYRDARAGRHSCSCGGDCRSCPGSSLCHPQKSE